MASEIVQLEPAEVEQVQNRDEGETQQQTEVTTNLHRTSSVFLKFKLQCDLLVMSL